MNVAFPDLSRSSASLFVRSIVERYLRETFGGEGKYRPSIRLVKRTTAIDTCLRKCSLACRTIGHVHINPSARQETRNSTFLPRCHLSMATFYVTRRLRDPTRLTRLVFLFLFFLHFFLSFTHDRFTHERGTPLIFNATTIRMVVNPENVY